VDDLITNENTPWDEGDREALMGLNETALQKLVPVVNQPLVKPKDLTPAERKAWDEMDEEEQVEFLKNRKAPTKNKGDEKVESSVSASSRDSVVSLTVDEYIDQAPDEVKEVLQNSLALHREQKDKLIATITANKANRFPRQALVEKSLTELQAIAALAAPKRPVNNYVGMGDGGSVGDTVAEEPLQVPVFNFGKDD